MQFLHQSSDNGPFNRYGFIQSGIGTNGMLLQGENGSGTSGNLILNPWGGNVGIGEPNPSAKLEVNGEIKAERIQAKNCSNLVKTVSSLDYAALQGFMTADNSTQNICGSGWHVCNAQEVGIYGIVYGCSWPSVAWIIGGFPNMDLHNRSIWSGQDSVQCQTGNYPTWYGDFNGYKGRIHCYVGTAVLPVACCKIP